jgi:redox-sensitive bicupin YhaK (pirin superfamily)
MLGSRTGGRVITIRRAGDRGRTQLSWLDSRHTFSFGDYHDPAQMGFGSLRVINDDRVAPGQGFAPHSHRDMEIVTWVLDGALEHRDSLGNGSVIRPGDLQRMSAGTGITHSEFNPSRVEAVHLLQIWILPERTGLAPGYAQQTFAREGRRGRLRLVAAGGGRDGSVSIHQDVAMLAGLLAEQDEATYRIAPGRHGWVHVATGRVSANGEELRAGDGAAVTGEPTLALRGLEQAEVLVFDLA